MAHQDLTYNVMRSVKDKFRRLKKFYRIARHQFNRRKKQERPEEAQPPDDLTNGSIPVRMDVWDVCCAIRFFEPL